jgi:hypothetical protein
VCFCCIGVGRFAARSFSLGSGLTDALRRVPPPVGSIVTFRCAPCLCLGMRARASERFIHLGLTHAVVCVSRSYDDLTPHGKPRFARFDRVRNDMSWEDMQAPPPRRGALSAR